MRPGALFTSSLAVTLTQYAFAGVAGSLILQGSGKLAPRAKPVARRMAVGTVAQSIVLGRYLAKAAEETALRLGDVMAEAHSSLGEEARPPAPVTLVEQGCAC